MTKYRIIHVTPGRVSHYEIERRRFFTWRILPGRYGTINDAREAVKSKRVVVEKI